MGRLEDIVERNQRALRQRKSYVGLVLDFLRDEFGPKQPAHERKRKLAALVITLVVVAAAGAGLAVWLHGRDDGIRDRDIAARAQSVVTDLDGKRFELANLWRERPAIIAFYVTLSCERCAAQLQELAALGREHHVAVAAVAFNSNGIDAMSARLGPQVPLYTAQSSLERVWKISWQNTESPAMFVVAAGGDVIYRKTCPDFEKCSLRAEIEPAFAATTR